MASRSSGASDRKERFLAYSQAVADAAQPYDALVREPRKELEEALAVAPGTKGHRRLPRWLPPEGQPQSPSPLRPEPGAVLRWWIDRGVAAIVLLAFAFYFVANGPDQQSVTAAVVGVGVVLVIVARHPPRPRLSIICGFLLASGSMALFWVSDDLARPLALMFLAFAFVVATWMEQRTPTGRG